MGTPLRARAELSRQLEHDDLLVFWRSRASGAREGLVGAVDLCPHPECICSVVRLDCKFVDETLRELRAEREVVRFVVAGREPPPSTGLARIVLDYETGAAYVETADAAGRAEEMLAWIQQEADGELLDALHARSSRARGLDSRMRELPEIPEPGEMVFWSDVYPGAREDRYVVGGKSYLLGEMFCVEEGCECEDVRFVVWDVTDGEYGEDVGSWLIDTDGGIEWTLSAASKETLHEIWAAYQRRHRATDRLGMHRADVRAAVAEARRARAVKIGRNERCPCGSGKKYKKCCGG
jgi:hypothetical protein